MADRTFPTSFRGFDQGEVRTFLATVADELREAAEAGERAAAELLSRAEERATALLSEAQDEARRLRATVDLERERAYAEGAARADELIDEAERVRTGAEGLGNAEAERLVAEARAVRERILGDLARRRATLREQVEQLHAARERLLGALADLRTQVDNATGGLRAALPEAKAAADAAARRVAAEPLASPAELEREIDAFRAAGLDMSATADEPVAAEPAGPDPAEVEAAAVASEAEAPRMETVEEEVPERRSTSVRVFRTRRRTSPALGLPEAELHEVQPAAPFEEVRLVTTAGGEEADVEVQSQPETAAGVAATAPADASPVDDREQRSDAATAPSEPQDHPHPTPTETIDELFARLKAGREQRKAAAEVVLAPEPLAEADSVATGVSDTAPSDVESADAEQLARRDEALAGPREALVKRLKRQLADEENEVLHGLRRQETRVFELADADDHAAVWSLAAAHDLAAAASVGATFHGGDPGPVPASEVAGAAEALAEAYARPLRTKVLEVIDAAGDTADDTADAVRATYRDRRGRRLEDAVDHAVLDAFAIGVAVASPVGAEFRWVVDDGVNPCPDCADNGLAGALPTGSPFPTGHVRPPAHPGCRCLLVPARDGLAAPPP